MTILVVDDEPTMPRLFEQRYRREIREGRHRFVFAASGAEALLKLSGEAAAADLVLSDINMPGMSGLGLLERMRSLQIHKPVFIISAYDGSEYETQALEKGAQGFLAKPLSFDQLNKLFARYESTLG